jgi:hypothetical protein
LKTGAGWLLGALFVVSAAWPQEKSRLPTPPDFSQPAIATAARGLVDAWDAWNGTNGDLEQRVVHLPMSEARFLIQRALGRYMDFLDRRASYTESVATYIDECRQRRDKHAPKVEDVYEDEARLIGVNVLLLNQKLSALKDASEWTDVYNGSQAEAKAALKIQSARQEKIPLAMPGAPPPEAISALLFRKSEREVQEALQKLWTRYYQVLVDAIEQKPDGSTLLAPIRVHGGGTDDSSSAGQTAPAPPVPEAWKLFVGAWSYVKGSQQFNGIAEPASALLEIWFENNTLIGRYRAELPDFQGFKKLDLRMRGNPGNNNRQLTMHFESKTPAETGQIVLEPMGPSGVDMMLIRVVSPQSPIPRGRELLVRR